MSPQLTFRAANKATDAMSPSSTDTTTTNTSSSCRQSADSSWNEHLRQSCSVEVPLLTTDTTSQHQSKCTPLQRQLLERAAQVRSRLGPSPPSHHNNNNRDLYFASSFQQGNHPRGFCNWLIPNLLLMGQYPGQNPLVDGPSQEEVRQHLQQLVQHAHVGLFCCLQSETPAQTEDAEWEHAPDTTTECEHVYYLQPASVRQILPRPFVQYAPMVRELSCHQAPIFLHAPIQDLNVPESQEPLQKLLLDLLEFLGRSPQQDNPQREATTNNNAIYLHCWGGRGRAGLVGACLLSLLWPQLPPKEILDWVQSGYATRLGHAQLPDEFAHAPQTCQQRAFVTQFVVEYQDLYKKWNGGGNDNP